MHAVAYGEVCHCNGSSLADCLIKTALHVAQASQTLAKGQQKYAKGDRMGALRLFEQALAQVGRKLKSVRRLQMICGSMIQLPQWHLHVQEPGLEDRQAALFNSTCVHASFGDVEFAQVTLRGGYRGLLL